MSHHSLLCRCPLGKRLASFSPPDADLCVPINECAENPSLCHHGDCHDTETGFYCSCQRGYGGPACQERRGVATLFITMSAVLALAVCAIAVLCELIVTIIYM